MYTNNNRVNEAETNSLSLLTAIIAAINKIIAIIENIGLILVNVLICDLQTYMNDTTNKIGIIMTFTNHHW